jgi:hypothetical protein
VRGRHIETQAPTPLDQRVGGLPLPAIDIVREDIARVFRDKLGVSVTHGDSHIGNPMTTDLTMTHIPIGQGYPNFQIFRVTWAEAHMNTHANLMTTSLQYIQCMG